MSLHDDVDARRNLRKADTWLREGKWGKTELTGYLLTGKTLGVIGLRQHRLTCGVDGCSMGYESHWLR